MIIISCDAMCIRQACTLVSFWYHRMRWINGRAKIKVETFFF